MLECKPDFVIPENLRNHSFAIDRKIEIRNGELETEIHRVIVHRPAFVSAWRPSTQLALREASEFLEKHTA